MKLAKGQKAIDFSAIDAQGKGIKLSSYRGSKVLLSFFRDVHCPFCNLRVHYLSSKREELEATGLKLILFFESTNEQLRRSAHHQKMNPIPLVGDHEKTVYTQYGIEASTSKLLRTFIKKGVIGAMKKGTEFDVPRQKEKHVQLNLIPADFLIDEQGIIQRAHYGAEIRDHLPIEDIKAFAEG